ncbi:hypothetical protein D3C72_2510860 [compost metagenome]
MRAKLPMRAVSPSTSTSSGGLPGVLDSVAAWASLPSGRTIESLRWSGLAAMVPSA